MAREDIVAIGVRLFVVFMAIMVLRTLAGMASGIDADDRTAMLMLMSAVGVVGFAVCLVLWVFPLTVARRLMPAMKEPRSEAAMDGPVAMSVGLTLLGVWVFATALPDAIYWLALFQLSRRLGSDHFSWGDDQIASMIATAVQLVLATWLVFGAVGIRRLIERYRYGRMA